MTLKTIVQGAADEILINRPSTVVGNGNPEVQRLFRLSQKVGQRLMKSVVWQALRGERTFTALPTETQTGILPADFDRFITETFWDRTTILSLIGPITPVEWQAAKASTYSGARRKFIHRGDSVLTIPAFGGGESLAFEYVKKNWCKSSGGTPQETWLADTDVGILDEELMTLALIYVYLEGEGQPSDMAKKDFEDYANTILDNDQPNSKVMVSADIFGGGKHFTGEPGVQTYNITVI